ncbi:MAG: CHRD domain-containing protein [Actinomycetota bacterium]|nr:CHRD domain-containing protein [Actinomycetota bacterium]
MTGVRLKVVVGASALLVGGVAATAIATGGDTGSATLRGFAEVPTVSSPGNGTFDATIDTAARRITYTLSYDGLSGRVQQAHIHLGRRSTAGGVSAFLCTNIGGGTARTPACPRSGEVTGTLRPADVLGPSDQGIAGREFGELVRALRAGATYVNVHTGPFPAGEIRGQIG